MELAEQLAVLAAVTLIAVAAAFGMAWAFLQAAFRLMEPAAAVPAERPRLQLGEGTRAAARGFARS